jgi:hypothetical protein
VTLNNINLIPYFSANFSSIKGYFNPIFFCDFLFKLIFYINACAVNRTYLEKRFARKELMKPASNANILYISTVEHTMHQTETL